MKITPQLTDERLLQALGARLCALRLARNLTQAALAEQAGVSKRTVERLEFGAVAAQLTAFLRVCRVLGLIDALDAMIPQVTASPLAELKLQGKQRQRASRKRAPKVEPFVGVAEPQPKWTWRDKP